MNSVGWPRPAGPPKGYYFDELIASDVEVTNFRGIFNDHISAHVMAFMLVLCARHARLFPRPV